MDSKEQALINNLKNTKQDKLVSSQNIKTINGQSILGHGNLDVSGGLGAVKSVNGEYPDETGNVTVNATDIAGFATVAISGNYNDLLDTPTIPVDTNQKIKAEGTSFGDNDEIDFIGDGIISITPNASDKTITISATVPSAPSAIVDYEDELPEVTTDNKDSLARLDGDEVYAAEYREQQGEEVELLVQSTTSNQPSKALAQEWWDANQTYVTINTINNVKGFFYNTPEAEKPNCPFNIGSNKNIGYITFTIKDAVTTPITLLARAYIASGVAKQSSIKVTDPYGNETNYTLSTELNENNFPIATEITLSSIGQYTITGISTTDGDTTNNMFLLSGIRFGSSAQIVKNWHQLARKEYVNDQIDIAMQPIEDRLDTAETNIDTNAQDIVDLQVDLIETKRTIGNVQIWDANTLPTAGEEYLKKILRVDGVLWECIKNPDLTIKNYSFENVSGTSNITLQNYNDFARSVTDGFKDDLQLVSDNDFIFAYRELDEGEDVSEGLKYRLNLNTSVDVDFSILEDPGVDCMTLLLSNSKLLSTNFAPQSEYLDLPLSNLDFLYTFNYTGVEEPVPGVETYIDFDSVDDETAGRLYNFVDFKVNYAGEDIWILNQDNCPISERYLTSTSEEVIRYLGRNNGEIKLGNSSNNGCLKLTKNENSSIPSNLPLTKIKFNALSWSSTKGSCLLIEFINNQGNGAISYAIRKYLEPSEEIQEIIIDTDDEGRPLSIDLSLYNIVISSDSTPFLTYVYDEEIEDRVWSLSYPDKRIRLSSMQFIYGSGDEMYLWKEVSGGSSISSLITPITYDELKELRDNESLIPGMQYRITDYHCTTTQLDTQSADHQFDIIVTADSESVLNENARAFKHGSGGSDDNGLIIQNGVFTCTPDDSMVKHAQFIDTEEDLDGGQGLYITAHGNSFEATGYLEDRTPVIYLNKEDYRGIIDEYNSYFKYVGVYSYEGVEYDRWMHCNHTELGEIIDTPPASISSGRYILTRKNGSSSDYFANAKLEAWQLKYCLDNDTTRFAWADEENGKGVIYYMKDEWNNECPYDFKNIQFKRYKVTDITDNSILSDLDNRYLGFLERMQGLTIENENDFIWCYTFDCESDNQDISIRTINVVSEGFDPDSWYSSSHGICTGNKLDFNFITVVTDDTNAKKVISLNNIVVLQMKDNQGLIQECINNSFGAHCYSCTLHGFAEKNVFGDKCCYNIVNGFANTFGNECIRNTFGNNCESNTFDNNCHDNIFSSRYYLNRFNNSCGSNIFGSDCHHNTFSNDCSSNIFGNSCHSNTFSNDCGSNTFGNSCYSNTFDNSCYNNTFGNNCYNNMLGNQCNYNLLASDCLSNSFGNSCSYIELANRCKNNIFENGVEYIRLLSNQSQGYIQNITIRQGVRGVYNPRKVITESRGLDHSVTYVAAGSEEKTI